MSQPDLTPQEQAEAGRKTSAPFRGSLPMLGVTDASIPAIEASYEALLKDLQSHFSEHDFLFGSRPSIGDFGLFGPLYAHLYRDPASGDLMKRIAPAVADWVERMNHPDAETQVRKGEFLPNDEVPATLLPALTRLCNEYLPVLKSTLAAVQNWLQQHHEEEIPRVIGMHDFTLEAGQVHEVTEKRGIFPFDQWMAQRPLFYYQGLNQEQKAQADELLRAIGAEDLSSLQINIPLKRENFKLVRAG